MHLARGTLCPRAAHTGLKARPALLSCLRPLIPFFAHVRLRINPVQPKTPMQYVFNPNPACLWGLFSGEQGLQGTQNR